MKEFRTIQGWQGLYKINEKGEVLSLNYRRTGKPKLVKLNYSSSGYVYVNLNKHNIGHKHSLHRLVAQTFLNNPENKPQVNHKDGNKRNNHLKNLEWATAKENRRHGIDNGFITFRHGAAHKCAVLTEKQRNWIKLLSKDYSRSDLSDIFNISITTINKIPQFIG